MFTLQRVIQKTAYNGTDFIPFSKPKFFCEMRIEYGHLYFFAKIFICKDILFI